MDRNDLIRSHDHTDELDDWFHVGPRWPDHLVAIMVGVVVGIFIGANIV
jgi:hypothetical protein